MWYRWATTGKIVQAIKMQVGSVIQAAKNEERRNGCLAGDGFAGVGRQGSGSGTFILDPGSWFLSRIPDLGSGIPDPTPAKKEWGKIFLSYFSCIHKYHKNESYLIFEQVEKKIWANSQIITVLFTPKIVDKLSKYGSGIRDPGVKKARDPGSGPAVLYCKMDAQCFFIKKNFQYDTKHRKYIFVVDRHRFDADLDLNWQQNGNLVPDADWH